MRLPEIQEEIVELSSQLRKIANRLKLLSNEISRRKPEKRAPRTSARMTPALANEIRGYAKLFPKASQVAIGKVFNVNPARVSETLRGKRK